MSLNKKRIQSISESFAKSKRESFMLGQQAPELEHIAIKSNVYECKQLAVIYFTINKSERRRELFKHYLLSYIELNRYPLPFSFREVAEEGNTNFDELYSNIMYLYFQTLLKHNETNRAYLHNHVKGLKKVIGEPQRASKLVFEELLTVFQ